jgi:hypothetical protein
MEGGKLGEEDLLYLNGEMEVLHGGFRARCK